MWHKNSNAASESDINLHRVYTGRDRRGVMQKNTIELITFTHLADAFIQSDLQCIIHFLSVCVFPGN